MSKKISSDQSDGHKSDDFMGAPLKLQEFGATIPHSLLHRQLFKAMLDDYPDSIKKRLRALKSYQFKTIQLEAQFYENVHELEIKYHKLYLPYFEKRAEVINGIYEPLEEECDININSMVRKIKGLQVSDEDKLKISTIPSSDASGIPNFWLSIFRNVSMLSEMVELYDEPILKHLMDIKIRYPDTIMGFVLEFQFSPNEYFTNPFLTKEYILQCDPGEMDPFNYEGPLIIRSSGCKIEWYKGKNVTVKTVKKKQKHKSRPTSRVVCRTIPNDSFFNFFNPPVVPDLQSVLDDETSELVATDFEIGHFIREHIIPRAILFFTGEAFNGDDEEELEEEEEDMADETDPFLRELNKVSDDETDEDLPLAETTKQ